MTMSRSALSLATAAIELRMVYAMCVVWCGSPCFCYLLLPFCDCYCDGVLRAWLVLRDGMWPVLTKNSLAKTRKQQEKKKTEKKPLG